MKILVLEELFSYYNIGKLYQRGLEVAEEKDEPEYIRKWNEEQEKKRNNNGF